MNFKIVEKFSTLYFLFNNFIEEVWTFKINPFSRVGCSVVSRKKIIFWILELLLKFHAIVLPSSFQTDNLK